MISSGKLLRQIVDDVLDCKYQKYEAFQFSALPVGSFSHLLTALFSLQTRNWKAETPMFS